MKRKVFVLLGASICIALLAVFGYGLFFADDPGEIPSAQIGLKAKSFRVTTFDGRAFSLEDFRGHPVILNFWASWCISCRQEAHLLEAAHRRYSPAGVIFIGIAINDTEAAALDFIRRHRKTYLLAPDDASGSMALDYGVTAVPETYFIDRNGLIQNKILGPVTADLIDGFLAEQGL